MIVKTIGLASTLLLLTGVTVLSVPSSAETIAPLEKTHASHHLGFVKPGAAVELRHDYDGQTQIGEIETLTLTLDHMYSDGYLTVQVLPTHGLQITSDMNAQQMRISAGSNMNLPVQFSSRSNGTYDLGVEAVYESLDGSQSRRVLSLPITVGSKATENSRAAKSKDIALANPTSTDGIIALPAHETIK